MFVVPDLIYLLSDSELIEGTMLAGPYAFLQLGYFHFAEPAADSSQSRGPTRIPQHVY